VADEQIPADAIAWQSTPAGTSVASETAIAVGVSNGGTQRMPSLIGLRLDEARQVLDPLGVMIGSVTERNTQAFASGTVIDHQPPADSAIASGGTVSIILAR
jgi:serine/threonine-protein kinase